MRNAFLVSDEDLRAIKTQPWFVEMQGEAVFMHESVLKLIQQQQFNPNHTSIEVNPKTFIGRSLLCDQPSCPRSQPGQEFSHYSARQTHRAMSHGIPGASAHRRKVNPPPSRRMIPPPPNGTLFGATTSTQEAINRVKPASYQYQEFDRKGVCGIGDCDYKPKGKNKVRALHFHRSVKHNIRGINWNRASHIKARGKRHVGRPRKKVA